jgi:hypothetical protein
MEDKEYPLAIEGNQEQNQENKSPGCGSENKGQGTEPKDLENEKGRQAARTRKALRQSIHHPYITGQGVARDNASDQDAAEVKKNPAEPGQGRPADQGSDG